MDIKNWRFRGWHKNRKEMLDAFDLDMICKLNAGYGFSDDLVVMPSTGKHDLSGKEVFEGDIIENSAGVRMEICYGIYPGYCPADRCYMDCVGFYAEASGYPQMPVGPLEQYAKVIGNIFENPQLMEKSYTHTATDYEREGETI